MKILGPSKARHSPLLFDAPWARAAIALLVLSSVFQGVSILTLKLARGFEVGIAPYWAFAALIVLAALPALVSAKASAASSLPKPLRWAAFSLTLFALYGAASAFSLPFVFHGIAVLDPRLGIANQFMDPSSLSWGLSNAGQAGYILLNCAVFWLLIFGVRTHEDLRKVYGPFLAVGWLVLAFAVFQRVSTAYVANQLYPAIYSLTHNNPAVSSYPMMDPRTTSFFLEPSFLGGFAGMIFAMSLSEYFFKGRRASLALSVLSTYVVLSSESTVGLALIPVGLMLALVPWAGSARARPEAGRRLGMRRRFRNALLGLLCAIVLYGGEQAVAARLQPLLAPTSISSIDAGAVESPAATASPDLAPSPIPASPQLTPVPSSPSSTGPASGLLDLGSRPWADRLLSVKYRFWADEFSIFQVTKATLFLGAGLGSNRPSSFLAYVISNTGLPGLLAIASFLVLVARSCFHYRDRLEPSAASLCAGMFTYLLAMFGGLPDPSWPPFLWILGGLVVAGLGLAARSVPASAPASNPD